MYDDPLERALPRLVKALGTYGLDYKDLVERFCERFGPGTSP